ncbi:unnamed protein product [Musa acuminata var. zebrina]
MSCFSCFSSQERRASRKFDAKNGPPPAAPSPAPPRKVASDTSTELSGTPANGTPKSQTTAPEASTFKEASNDNIAAQTFTFRELASATKNFRPESLLGEGGFGRVYKGRLDKPGQVVAVKQLDRSGLEGNKEFLVEVLMLSLLHHQNLVSLIGYCADGDQRMFVSEDMPLGSLEDHLLEISPDQEPLTWYTRMKIALGAAKGLEYLHQKANPPVIFRDLKSSNILLDEDCDAKLSDFGLAKLGPVGDELHVSSRVMDTYGYCAPEYARTGQLTLKSDVYSYGVVLLELITGRRAIDTTRPTDEQNLVTWAQPKFRDQMRYRELVDPLLRGEYAERGLNQAVAVAAMCLQEEPEVRPFMTDVVAAFSHLTAASTDSEGSIERRVDGEGKRDEKMDGDRQRAVAEAMDWGSEFKARPGEPP